MEFLDKRIQVICDTLKKLSVVQRIPTTDWTYRKGFFLHAEEALADPSALEPFDARTMHWYGPDEHYWFHTEVTVPESFDGKPLWFYIRTNIEEWDDAKNPQFLVFLDGMPIQGADMNHRDIKITDAAEAGRVYALDLQAYTGTLHSEFSLFVDMQEVDPEVRGLFYDIQVPLWGYTRLEKDNPSRIALENALNDTINLLDFRDPGNAEFYESVARARAYVAKAVYEDLAGHDEVIASCIGHTHIDVAWWWTVAQTREKAARSFATVLKLMEEFPDYKFMSSQPVLYSFVKERYPELYAQIKARIAEGRWEPEGGMWLEADCNLTSGESLVRQFIHGKRFFKEEFGKDNEVLWLPDVFGYNGALPQIMQECGIKYFMTTKISWNQFDKMPYDTFLWRGIDGSEVLTHFISTQTLGTPPERFMTDYNARLWPPALQGGWKRYQQKELKNDFLVCFGHGDGGGGPTREMLEAGRRMSKGFTGTPKARYCFAHQFFEELDATVRHHKRIPTWVGELYFEYHRGTLTSIARNKRANRKAELSLMDLELFSVLAQDQIAYPTEAMDRLWKGVLLNQFHDILPGSSIHEVYEVTKREYEEMAAERAKLIDERLALLAPPAEDALTLYNTTGFMRDDIVSLGECAAEAIADADGRVYPVQQTKDGAVAYVTGLPSKGYKTFHAAKAPGAAASPFVLSEDGHVLTTPFYQIRFDEAGTITSFIDRANDRELVQAGQRFNLLRMYEDKPIYFDDWDIDIFYTEKSWDVLDLSGFEWGEPGPVELTLTLTRKISNSTIRQTFHFYAESRRIDVDSWVDWKQHQHLLKVHFPVDIHTDEASFDIQFGNLKRKTHTNTSWDVARFESCGHKWMDLSEGHYGFSLLNDCKYGHSVKDSNIGLTLIKSGIEPNPMADYEEHVFRYSFWPHAEGWREAGTVPQSYFVNQPVVTAFGLAPKASDSLAFVDGTGVVLETVKAAEDGDGIILRMYECDGARTRAKLHYAGKIASVEECNAIEEKKRDLTAAEGVIDVELHAYEIKTLRIRG